jgi:hypothetical protein
LLKKTSHSVDLNLAGGFKKGTSMKRLLSMTLALTAVLTSAGLSAGQLNEEPGETLAQKFAAPPDTAKPWVYWFWSDGNITKEGITADLEAMKRAGIGGVLIMEVDQGPPKGPARFMSPRWRELFKFVLAEARRIGIEVNMNNDAGWCGSGGPWITPENSMQKVVWTETRVAGPKRVDTILKQPETVKGYYRDIAVLAFPTPAAEGARGMAAAKPKLTASWKEGFDATKLLDGNPSASMGVPKPEPDKPQFIQIEFEQPYAARRLIMPVHIPFYHQYAGQLEISADGKNWRKIASFSDANGGSVTFNKVESNFYRVVFTSASVGGLGLGEVDLTLGYRINGFAAKSGMGAKAAFDADVAAIEPELIIAQEKIVDLTARMDSGGKLTWDVPPGDWTVLRLGHTTTGKDNHPAPEEGRGLECDKLSKAGIEAQFAGLVEKLVRDSGPESTEVMTHVHIDSWEVGCQNWTDRMREEFRNRRGYDLFPFLPAMTGRAVVSPEASERFLFDLRRTISEMLNDYYAGGLRELAAEHGMKLSIEAYSDGPFDCLSYAGRCDMPIAEFWTGQAIHASLKPMASSGHIYGNSIVAAEAFTATNTAGRQRNHPGSIKALGDEAFANGINRFIFHRYSLQPWATPARVPGMTMGPWGLEYERTATWWEQSTAWHQYLARCQYLLQQGTFQADLLYLNDEEGYTPLKTRQQMQPAVPEGYDYDICAPEAILKRASVKDGRIVVEGGMNYRLLVLPQVKATTPDLLGKIKELVTAGATVLGAAPLKSPSYENYPQCDEEVKTLVASVWGDCDGKTVTEHACGKGKVVWGRSPADVLKGLGIAPDVTFQTDDASPAFHAIHRNVGDTDLYFVANGNPRPVEAVCSFRMRDRRPEVWHPDTGRIERPAVYDTADGRVSLPIKFDPSGSAFVIFRKGAAAETDRVTQVALNDKPIRLAIRRTENGAFRARARRGGNYTIATAGGRQLKAQVPPPPAPVEIEGPWEVSFPPHLGAPPKVTLDRLISLSEHPEPGVKYFSSTATYTKTIHVPAEMLDKGRSVVLDLGDVQVSARVKLNGRDLGILWKPPYRIEITDAIEQGANALEVASVNLWVNRLIGDEQLPDDCKWNTNPYGAGRVLAEYPQWLLDGKPSPTGRITFTTWRHYKKDDPLLPSGLIGPVRLVPMQNIAFSEQ